MRTGECAPRMSYEAHSARIRQQERRNFRAHHVAFRERFDHIFDVETLYVELAIPLPTHDPLRQLRLVWIATAHQCTESET